MLTATDIAPRRLGGFRVLVVETQGDSAACLAAMLRLNGFDSRIAHTGSAALRGMAELQPAAVIVDLDLPDMDGSEVIREASVACPVVVVTAHADAAHRSAALAAGARAYMLKPADPVALVRTLTELCSPA